MLSILALISFVVGLVVLAATEASQKPPLVREIARMLMWCGFLVLLLDAGGWHAQALR